VLRAFLSFPNIGGTPEHVLHIFSASCYKEFLAWASVRQNSPNCLKKSAKTSQISTPKLKLKFETPNQTILETL